MRPAEIACARPRRIVAAYDAATKGLPMRPGLRRHPCTLGEGPLWHPEREQLFWFDIMGKRLSRTGDDRGMVSSTTCLRGGLDRPRHAC
jgi:hypothetical protein